MVSQQPDSGFFCEENSSDDDVILKEEFRGVVIKQGCLLKQVGDRHYFTLAFPPFQTFRFFSKSRMWAEGGDACSESQHSLIKLNPRCL